jgi:hypothetical protein
MDNLEKLYFELEAEFQKFKRAHMKRNLINLKRGRTSARNMEKLLKKYKTESRETTRTIRNERSK